MLTSEAIKKNLTTYKNQVGKILDMSKVEFHHNSTWLSKLGFQEIAELAESFSVQQMSNRRNFKERFDKGEEVSLREFLYPLMQGYDSVAVKADVELGGFDQLFNVKAGRIIQKHYGQPEQDVLTIQMLEGTDGRKMSSSWGNVITLVDEPDNMYGKIMSVRDELLEKYFLLCTDLSLEDIESIKKELANGANPKDLKMRLAREIVTLYHGADAAKKAEENFINTFKKGGLPEDTPEVEVIKDTLLVDVFLQNKIISSKTEFRTLINDGAVSIVGTEEKIVDPFAKIEKSADYKIGKRRFIRVLVK